MDIITPHDIRMMGYLSDQQDDETEEPRTPRCNRCGSTDVRWRQQTGKWVLFSLAPGKVHVCRPSEDDFDAVP